MSLLRVSPPPHITTRDDTASIMLDVILALMPAIIAGAYFFGYRAVVVVAVCVITAVLFEYLWTRLFRLSATVADLSAVVSGLLLGMNLPVTAPLWMCVAGSFFMMIIVKAFFGGLGQNFVNPALAARAFMLASWPSLMTRFVAPFTKLSLFNNVDVVTSATPLAAAKEGAEAIATHSQLFFGSVGGCIGETSAVALLIGFAYLLIRRVVSWRIPVVFVGVVAVLTYFTGGDAIAAVLSGGLLLGAIFMATDYTTSPLTKVGQLIYAVGCGLIVYVIRRWGGYPEGVTYAILLMNVTTPLIDKLTPPARFGRRTAR